MSSSTSSSSGAAATLVAGRVGRAHGLDGSFRVVEPRPQLLWLGARVTVAGAEREIVRRAGTDAAPILRLDGVSGRDQLEPLRGQALLVPRSAAPALDEDEYWAEDLEGCAVRDGEVAVGVVERLLAYPSCDLLEVRRGDDLLLVPLVRDAVRSVDVAARVIDIDLAFLGEE
ncbi:MAG: 16S rRNA processing protein RimM [Actinobacteria bacterium]|nr:MAG: 16S rRNA processing protein RimM [Actinomycetota bacterium]